MIYGYLSKEWINKKQRPEISKEEDVCNYYMRWLIRMNSYIVN